ESSAEVPEGIVIRTSPNEGLTVQPGQVVTVYISTGAEMTTVPLLVGLDQETAREAITDASLQVGTIIPQNDPSPRAGSVLSATYEPDTPVTPGTVINLVVASGNDTLNDVTPWALDSAVKTIEALGLEAVPVELTTCPATNPHTVASMSAAPGDVPIRSTVELSYCTGEDAGDEE